MLVSVVIPARNWDHFLVATLESLAVQYLPRGVGLEVVVGLAGEPPPEVPNGVEVVHNPSGSIPDALNLAIGASRGEVVARVDARCVVAPDHIARVVDALSDPQIGCVGGAALVMDRGGFASAYAVAFNSPLLGPSDYRYRRRSGSSSSPYCAAWRREVLERTGGFDPRLLRNQDNELADRVANLGLSVWYDADIVVGYFNDREWLAAMRHHYEFGWWRMLQSGRGQRGLGRRHIVSIGSAVGGGVMILAGLRSRGARTKMIAGLVAAYGLAATTAFITARRLRDARGDIDLVPFSPVGVALAPAVAASLDAAWFAGLLVGAMTARVASEAE